jgi:hypothetical protein
VQAGILEDQPADSGVRSALLADPGLSERQKQVLIEIYESFRKENVAAGDGDATVTVLPHAIPTIASAGPDTPDAPDIPPARARRRDKTWAAATDDQSEDTGPYEGSDPGPYL